MENVLCDTNTNTNTGVSKSNYYYIRDINILGKNILNSVKGSWEVPKKSLRSPLGSSWVQLAVPELLTKFQGLLNNLWPNKE